MINYKSLKDHVYDYISSKINDGSLRPGEKINENQICESLQVSRTPVREALLQLSNEGYLENLPRRGFIVKEVDNRKVEEIYAVLGCLEGMAAACALKKMTQSHMAVLEKLIGEMDSAIARREYNEYYKLQMVFHDNVIAMSGNEELHKLISGLKKKLIKQSYIAADSDEDLFKALEETNGEHKKILELFRAGDVSGLEAYMREVHWSTKYASLESLA